MATNVGDLIADAFRDAMKSDVALINGRSIRADLTFDPGELSRRDELSILPFPNPLVKIEISGQILKDALEHGVSRKRGRN